MLILLIFTKRNDFSNKEINDFINENEDNLKKDYIDFSYAKVTPQNLTGSNEFDNNFFEKIDELENKFLNGEEFENLMNELKIKFISKKLQS